MRDISRKNSLIWPRLRRHPHTSYCASGGISKVRHFLLYFRHFVLESCNFVIVWVIRWELLRSLGSPPIYHHRKRFCIQCSSKICRTCKLLAFGGALLTERKELKDDAHFFFFFFYSSRVLCLHCFLRWTAQDTECCLLKTKIQRAKRYSLLWLSTAYAKRDPRSALHISCLHLGRLHLYQEGFILHYSV